jgi:hypothetical protein
MSDQPSNPLGSDDPALATPQPPPFDVEHWKGIRVTELLQDPPCRVYMNQCVLAALDKQNPRKPLYMNYGSLVLLAGRAVPWDLPRVLGVGPVHQDLNNNSLAQLMRILPYNVRSCFPTAFSAFEALVVLGHFGSFVADARELPEDHFVRQAIGTLDAVVASVFVVAVNTYFGLASPDDWPAAPVKAA